MNANNIWQRIIFSKQDMHYLNSSEKEKVESSSKLEVVSEYMHSQGFIIKDDMEWTELSHDEANMVLAMQLSEDMAYGSRRSAGISSEAKSLANQFQGLFEDGATFYSNGHYSGELTGKNGGWTPITKATFDGGVIGIDKNKIAYIWFEDED